MSEICLQCGSTEFSLVDGFYFCNDCGTQSTTRREVDEEFIAQTQRTTKGVEKAVDRRKKEEFLSQRQEAAELEQRDVSVILDDRALPNDHTKDQDFPKYLGTVGYRLLTFTKLVNKISYILSEYSYWLIQEYFRKSGVAFHEKELGDDESKQFTPKIPLTEAERAKRKRAEKKARDETLRVEREARRSQLSAWEQIMSQDADVEEDTKVHEDEEMLFHDFIKTKLSTDTIKAAATIYLEIDMVLVLIFVSILLSGCKWIQLTDLFRWYREGRFMITKTQINALSMAIQWDKKDHSGTIVRRVRSSYEAVQPASECLSVLALFTQCIARQLPPVNVECGSEYFGSVLTMVDSLNEKLIQSRHLGPRSYFSVAFKDAPTNIYTSAMWNCLNTSQLMSTEVKAAALILFSLKLFFGLDDKREYNLKTQESAQNEGVQPFNFSDWLQQLRLRLHIWQGKSMTTLIDESFSADQSMLDEMRPIRRIRKPATQLSRLRREHFPKCVPNHVGHTKEKPLLYEVFMDDFAKSTDNSHEALFTPLAFHAAHNANILDEIADSEQSHLQGGTKSGIDKKNLEIFFRNFHNYNMDLHLMYDDNNTTLESDFGHIFPCSNTYQRIPPHDIPCLATEMYYKGANVKKTNSAQPVISSGATSNIFRSSKRFFSTNFATLLNHLAITVGETEDLLYFAFILCEALFLEKKRIKRLEENLKSGQFLALPVKNAHLSLQQEPIDGEPLYKLRYKIGPFRPGFIDKAPEQPTLEAIRSRERALRERGSEQSSESSTDSGEDELIQDRTCFKLVPMPQYKALGLLGFHFW
ncbi:zinc-finger of RNA-polymerase i-specific TFIIB, rrn7 domain-containing protein [Ditylenchus destructor]|uniref:TATA box-binding protein-associated factor RNA polymerase I subunit B n=1 Tax=Ditylenchus destructor TaxID=166010 RepID=A0AAD4N6C5_9BILA|nr:zinc-finger of RNA-polymerase i-specific TFIIB, rrn7 domain-containing protein [Ditylenchus destructor]